MVSVDLIFISAVLVAVFISCITDLKGRWVPDFVSYALIIFGICGHFIISVATKTTWPAITSLAGAGFFYLIALIMFYAGAWGGGDAKLFIGIGATLPTYPNFLNWLNPQLAPWPFLITVWLNSLVFGAILGLLAIFWLAIKHYRKIIDEVGKEFQKIKITLYGLLSSLIFPLILLIKDTFNLFAIFWILISILICALLITKLVEKTCMYKFIPPSKLVEGDWIAEEIKIWDKVIYRPKRIGIEQEEINKLVELEKQGKLKEVKVKEGLPYVPAF